MERWANERTQNLRRVEYFLCKVCHEDGAVAGDVDQSSDLAAATRTPVWIGVSVLSLLVMMLTSPAAAAATQFPRRSQLVVVFVQIVHVVAAFRRTGSVVCRVRAAYITRNVRCRLSVQTLVSDTAATQKLEYLTVLSRASAGRGVDWTSDTILSRTDRNVTT